MHGLSHGLQRALFALQPAVTSLGKLTTAAFVLLQLQKMQPDPVTGKMPYTGSLDCALKTLKAGGPLKFYTGTEVVYAYHSRT